MVMMLMMTMMFMCVASLSPSPGLAPSSLVILVSCVLGPMVWRVGRKVNELGDDDDAEKKV